MLQRKSNSPTHRPLVGYDGDLGHPELAGDVGGAAVLPHAPEAGQGCHVADVVGQGCHWGEQRGKATGV